MEHRLVTQTQRQISVLRELNNILVRSVYIYVCVFTVKSLELGRVNIQEFATRLLPTPIHGSDKIFIGALTGNVDSVKVGRNLGIS